MAAGEVRDRHRPRARARRHPLPAAAPQPAGLAGLRRDLLGRQRGRGRGHRDLRLRRPGDPGAGRDRRARLVGADVRARLEGRDQRLPVHPDRHRRLDLHVRPGRLPADPLAAGGGAGGDALAHRLRGPVREHRGQPAAGRAGRAGAAQPGAAPAAALAGARRRHRPGPGHPRGGRPAGADRRRRGAHRAGDRRGRAAHLRGTGGRPDRGPASRPRRRWAARGRAVGAALVLASDYVAVNLLPTQLPTGVVTGAVGAPYLLWLLATTNRESM